MRRSNRLVLAMIAIGFTAGMRVARASDVQGVLARPVRVLLDPPPPALAAGVQIQGIAAIASNDGCYTVPTCGYLDYTCKAGEESLCREQWTEIAAAAAAGRCVSFGARRDATGAMANNGRVRPFSEPPGTPDVYIASQGLGVAVSDCPPLLGCSVDLSAACVPPAGGTGGAGSGTGGVAGTGGAGAGGASATGGAAGTGGTPGTGGKAGGTGGAAASADAAAERPQLAAKQGCSLAAGAAGGGGSLAAVAVALLMAAARRGRRTARPSAMAEVGKRSRR